MTSLRALRDDVVLRLGAELVWVTGGERVGG